MMKIGICGGRPYEKSILLLNQMGFNPKLVSDSDRCFTFNKEEVNGQLIQYTVIKSRDMANLLSNRTIDIAVGYDDTIHHLTKKNYHIKPLYLEITSSDLKSSDLKSSDLKSSDLKTSDLKTSDLKNSIKLCLVGRDNVDLSNPMNIIASEYSDAQYGLSSFGVLKDRVRGRFIESHGTTESLISNGFADLGIMIVETGKTLKENNLKIYCEIRNVVVNAWINCDNPVGYRLIKQYRPDIKDVWIDGVDGAGKDTTIDLLKTDKQLKHFVFHNRGPMTQLTLLKDSELPDFKSIDGIHILLECNLEDSFKRCCGREKKDLKWENRNALSYFIRKYRELAARYGFVLINTSVSNPSQVCDHIRKYLLEDCQEFRIPRVDSLTDLMFEELKFVNSGESKIIKSLDDRFDVIRMKPTIYSHKSQRAGIIPDSHLERMEMTKHVLRLLSYGCLDHTYWYVGTDYILVERLKHLPPPIEVVVKSRYEGTDKYRYVGMNGCLDRFTGKPLFTEDHIYPKPYVRFDWRNSNQHKEGDCAISESLADHLLNVPAAKDLALATYQVLSDHFKKFGIEIWDICFFVTQDGDKLFGEISQDNARYKKIATTTAFDKDFDKDLWRSGNSSENVLEKWKLMTVMTKEYTDSFFKSLFS